MPVKTWGRGLVILLFGCLLGHLASAQFSPASGAGGAARPLPLPQSGRVNLPGSVTAQESASSAGGISTVNASIQVSGNYQGSVPSGAVPNGPISLTLADAVRRGLATNLGPISANNSVSAARAETLQALSALLPNIAVNASETVTQIDLAAYGFQFKAPPGSGFSIPTVVGPFAYSQAQATLNQSVLDFVQHRNWKAARESERASTLSARDSREIVVLAVAGTYLQTVAGAARVTSQRAQVDNAQAVYNQAVVRKEAGTNARIDVMRSLVELQTQQQRLSSLDADLRKQKIALARLIGLPLDRDLILSDLFGVSDVAIPDAGPAIQDAFRRRSDLRAAEAQVHAAELALSAAHGERLPSVSLNGDYGVIGPNPASTHGVFTVTGAVNLPIWEGGRIKSDIQQAEATLHQRQAELADHRGQVEQEVRTALIELETANGQVRLATTNRDYARETLAEARDRFNAGVATTVEVVQAQEQVAGAESDYIASLFSFNVAKISLARATGQAEADLPDLLGEKRP
ncbi:MAG: TolC family protein [Acidobacteriaceae bacterium]|nr:TolC family protein [Acidobacteriaceae bacterium]